MASGLSHHLFCIQSLHHQFRWSYYSTTPPCKASILLPNPNLSLRLRTKSAPRESPSTSIERSAQEPETPISSNRVKSPDPSPGSNSSLDSISLLLRPLRDGLKVDQLGLEILSIALPVALALAADPLTSLVDTAFVGRLGSVELAAVGVSASVFNLVSKLFNVPLLNITTSFVAEEQALVPKSRDESHQIDQDHVTDHKSKKILPSVSTSLALAAGIGVAEALALFVGSGFLMNTMGIPADSPMRVPAEEFLSLRAFGAPPIVIALAAQGTFRGFKDTKTPLFAVAAGNLLNAILDPILIFIFGLGIGGAAIATVISEYLIAVILLWKLNSKVLLVSPKIDGGRVFRYLKSGGLLITRSLAVLVTMTLATSMAAREGPIAMAGHQICLQVWLAVSLLTDALALAGQALLAGDYSQGDYGKARQVVNRIIQIGLITGVSLAVTLFLGFGALSNLFSNDSEVLGIALSGILFVAGSQPINALAFVLDGLYYGVSDFGYAAYSMVLVGMISSVFLVIAAPLYGLAGVWTGLFLFMTLRVAAGIWRLGTKAGPWKFLWSEMEQENT
ncbi:protein DETOXIFICATION 44, chloroplastic [Rhododendron vialii]|uniref:protein DETOXIFICATION 44, chloroplastic n=1 Tax=Rhododendron vialii TaxID=182163 RepID=UPI00265FFAE4|nr:protein DETOXIFICATION 44, chloroplastic [Rhododendron vialii]